MTLTDDQIIQYQALYKTRFGKDINCDEARSQADKLIKMVRYIYKPMTESEYRTLQKRRRP